MISDPDAPSITELREQLVHRLIASMRDGDLDEPELAADTAADIIATSMFSFDSDGQGAQKHLAEAMLHAARRDGDAACRAILECLSAALEDCDPTHIDH